MGFSLSRLKIQHVVLFSLFLYFIIITGQDIHDTDVWWHLKVGEYIFEHRTVPKTDIFSFSNTGHEWIAHEWGAELLYYSAYKTGGFLGLFGLNLVILSANYFLFGRLVYRAAAKDLTVTTVVVVICAVFTAVFWVFRPHLAAYLLFISFLSVLEMYRDGKNLLWLLPPLMALWVNIHGSFIMGIVLIGIYLISGLFSINFGRLVSRKWSLGERKNLVITLLLVIAAVAVNPNTTKMYYYPFFTLNSEAIMESITEWSSPDFHLPIFKAFLAYLFVVYVTLVISQKTMDFKDILMLGLFTYLAMYGARNMGLFMFVTGPIWAERLAGFLSHGRPQKQVVVLNWMVLAGVVFYGIYSLPSQTPVEEKVNREWFPYQAVKYMKKNGLKGTLFNNYDWGGYLLWTRFPDNTIFIDGRSDVYEDRVLPEYMRITKLKPDAYDLLLKYNPQYILLKPDAPVNHLIKTKGDWIEIYKDDIAVLYKRKKLDPDNLEATG